MELVSSLLVLLASGSITPPFIRPTGWTASDDYNWDSSVDVPQGPGGSKNVLVIPSTVDGLILRCNGSYPIEWVFHHSLLASHAIQRSSRGRWHTTVSTIQKSYDLFDTKSFEYIAELRLMGSSNGITGNYTCQKVGEEGVSRSVYVYWEATSPPFLIQQGQNNTAVLDPLTNSALIVCTIARPDVLVALFKYNVSGSSWLELKNSSIQYDSKRGFTVTNLTNPYGQYKCVANSDQKDTASVYVVKIDSPEAKVVEFGQVVKRPAKYGYDMDTQRMFCCSRSTAPTMMHFYCDHPVTCKLRKNALLDIENTAVRNGSCSTVRLFLRNAGIFRCVGDGIDIVREYFFPMGVQFGFGAYFGYNRNRTAEKPTPYFSWKDADPSKMIALRVWANKIYVGQNVTFGCQASSYYFSKGVRWVLGMKNGTQVTIKEALVNDTRGVGAHQWFRRNINSLVVTADLSLDYVGCYAPVWNTSEWKQQSLKLNISVPAKPKIMGSDGATVEVIEWYVNDTKKLIECNVTGDPVPSVYWKKDGKNVYKYLTPFSNETFITSRINISRVSYETHGEYVCTAKSLAGVVKKTYKVIIHERTSSGVIVTVIISVICILICLAGVAFLVIRIRNQKVMINKLAESAFKDVNARGNLNNAPADPVFDFNPPISNSNLPGEKGEYMEQRDDGSYYRM